MWVISRQAQSARIGSGLARGAALFITLMVSVPSAAHLEFPRLIQEHWGGDCAPLCTLCHTRPEGGVPGNPYLKPSILDGASYISKDLGNNRGEGEFFANLITVTQSVPTSDVDLVRMLETLDKQACSADMTLPGNTGLPCDSDGDKTPDMKEFRVSKDPDVAQGDLCVGPKYGCGASIAPHSGETSRKYGALVVALFGLALTARRRGRYRTSRSSIRRRCCRPWATSRRPLCRQPYRSS
jgi:hypothetical protein